ncbi:methyltransferase domain-containing protein [bacterium CPR1]|nr:methyltransferase domain-containing protein [bacterium CPR1]
MRYRGLSLVCLEKRLDSGGDRVNPDGAASASKRLGQEVFSGSFYDYPGPKGKLDVVTFWDSLDHLLQPDEALARVRDWLAPGGSVLIRVRNASWHYRVRRVQSLLRKIGLLRSRRYVGVIHRYGFTRKSLEQLLLKEGFHEISWQPADFTPNDRYGWVNSLKVKNALLKSYSLIARALFRLTDGRLYLFSSLLVSARVKSMEKSEN